MELALEKPAPPPRAARCRWARWCSAPDGAVLARAGNRTEAERDAAAHAELLALRAAARRRGAPRLPDCDLVVTLEPCPMCAAAISLFRIRRLVFGAYDPKGGGVEHGARVFDAPSCQHRPGGHRRRAGGGVGGAAARVLRGAAQIYSTPSSI